MSALDKFKSSGKKTETFTHDEFARAEQMNGREPAVTSENLKKMEEKRQADLTRRAELQGAAGQWDQSKAPEEAPKEAEAPKVASSVAKQVDSLQAAEAKAEDKPQAPVGERAKGSKRNTVLCVQIGGGKQPEEVSELEAKGNTVVTHPDYKEALEYCEQQKVQLMMSNLRVFVASSGQLDPAALKKFLGDVRDLFPINQPSAVVLAPTESHPALAGIHNPPYVVLTGSGAQVEKFIVANQIDLSEEEEKAAHAALTKIEDSKDSSIRDGRILTVNKDQDLRFKSSSATVDVFSCSMVWNGQQDLDLSCVGVDADGGNPVIINWGSRFAFDCFEHSGDVKKAPRGAKETIKVFAGRVPANTQAIYFVMTSYGGKPFSEVESLDATLTVAQGERGSEGVETFAELPSLGKGAHCAVILCRVYRTSKSSWAVTLLNEPHPDARTAKALQPVVQAHLKSNPLNAW